MYFHNKPMQDNDAPGAWPAWTPWGQLVGFFFFHIVRLWELMAHLGGAIFDPRCMIDRIHVKFNITMLYTKYTSFRTCGFKEDFFMYFPINSLWPKMTPQGYGRQGLYRRP